MDPPSTSPPKVPPRVSERCEFPSLSIDRQTFTEGQFVIQMQILHSGRVMECCSNFTRSTWKSIQPCSRAPRTLRQTLRTRLTWKKAQKCLTSSYNSCGVRYNL